MSINILRPLFDAGKLWQGNTETTIEVTDTGFPELNGKLSGRGWPAHMLIEILTSDIFSAPMRCAFSTWKTQQDARWIALVNPPLALCTERLMQEGINPKQVDVLNIPTNQFAWSLEQLANAVSTRSIIAWGIKNTHIHSAKTFTTSLPARTNTAFPSQKPKESTTSIPCTCSHRH